MYGHSTLTKFDEDSLESAGKIEFISIRIIVYFYLILYGHVPPPNAFIIGDIQSRVFCTTTQVNGNA